jgi:hypothetical protein
MAMDPSPGPSSGALAVAALMLDPIITRVLSRLDADERKHLRSTSKVLRDACDRQACEMELLLNPSETARALPCLYRLVQRGIKLKKLNLQHLTAAPDAAGEMLEAFL